MKRIMMAAVVLALLAGVAWWLMRGDGLPENKPISLTDGSVLYFRGATYGTNHHYQGGGALGGIARLLPGKWAARFRGGSRVTTGTPSLTVWMERRGAGGPQASMEYALGSGTNFSPVRTSHSLSSGMPGGGSIQGLGFDSFPRRRRTVTLRLYDRGLNWGDPKFAGEFTFNNPAFSAAAGWPPEPLPAVKKVDDFEVTLKEVFTGVLAFHGGELWVATNVAKSGVSARLTFSRAGRPYTDWISPRVEMSDATGNKTASANLSSGYTGEDFEMTFVPHLWSDESAWKMRFELSRSTNFAAAQLWTVPGIRLGAINLTNDGAFRTNLQGGTVEIESLMKEVSNNTTHHLKVRVRPDRPDYRLTLVEARDGDGRAVKRSGVSWGNGEYKYSVDLHTNAQRLDVTLALHQSQYVEFLVAPKVLDNATAKREREKRR